MLQEKYSPRLQKELFYQNIVQDIKKWTKTNLIEKAENIENYKKILCIIGPIGCGKTTIINHLFTNYQLIKIDPDSLRSNDKILDIIRSLVNFKSQTLADIEKWNNKNYKKKNNILVLDNIELCDKTISHFLNLLYNQFDVNIPVVAITNNPKNTEIFDNLENVTFIKFPKPSITDMNNLLNKITSSEIEFTQIRTSKSLQNKIIEKSEYDIRQLFYILEQLQISLRQNSNFDIENSLEQMDSKITDIDLSQKLYKLIAENGISFKDKFNIATSEPQLISYSIYQNYPNIINKYTVEMNVLDQMDIAADVIDYISNSNIINSNIYDQQLWELYDDYTFTGCVLPSMVIHERCKISQNENFFIDELVTFKDISYNFSNSLNDVKEICKNNNFCTQLQSIIDKQCILGERGENNINNTLNKDLLTVYIIIQSMIHCIEQINIYFDNNKRGKNTTKREKFKICDLIENDNNNTNVKVALEYISNFIYIYKIFEIDIQDILINKEIYNEKELRQRDINKIDIRIFKRLLNIFTFDNSNKLLKSHTEIAIQYQIFTKLINDINLNKENVKMNVTNIDKLIVDLENIWNLN